ncbi:MAG: VOC family protein [Nannocystaceae bacterium]
MPSPPEAPGPRPFRVLGLAQVAIGTLDRTAQRRLWVDLLGLSTTGTYRSETENVDEEILRLGAGDQAVELDLMQPIDPQKRPRVHEPALNHVGLWIDDLPAAVSWLAETGVRFAPGGIRCGASGHDICFIHPRGNAETPMGGGGC